MKPQPRIRKTIKWGGAAVTVLLVVMWIGSAWVWWRGIRWHTFAIEGGNGRVTLTRVNDEHRPWFHDGDLLPGPAYRVLSVTPFDLRLWFSFDGFGGLFGILSIPIWAPAVLAFLTTAPTWVLDALAHGRVRHGLCTKCSYNRAGLAADAKCPECGASPS